jgi:hypothetical protein
VVKTVKAAKKSAKGGFKALFNNAEKGEDY